MQLPKAHCGATKIRNSHEQVIMIGQHTPRHALATGSSQCLHELTPKGVNPMDALAGDAPMLKVHRRDVEDGVFQRRVWRPVPRPLSPLSILQQFVPLTRTEFSPDVHGDSAFSSRPAEAGTTNYYSYLQAGRFKNKDQLGEHGMN